MDWNWLSTNHPCQKKISDNLPALPDIKLIGFTAMLGGMLGGQHNFDYAPQSKSFPLSGLVGCNW
jgi:hypothetical protein